MAFQMDSRRAEPVPTCSGLAGITAFFVNYVVYGQTLNKHCNALGVTGIIFDNPEGRGGRYFPMFAKSLERKVLVVLLLSVAIITTAIIYFTNRHISREMLAVLTRDSKETLSVVAAGIRQTMASGNGSLIEDQLLDIKTDNKDLELFIFDTDQRVVFSSEVKSLGKALSDQGVSREIVEVLNMGFQKGTLPDENYEEERGGKRYFMHAHLMENHEQCFRCHGANKKILGAVLLRKSIDRSYASIAALRDSNIVISILGVCSIILISHILITRLITRPVRKLSREITALPERIHNSSFAGGVEITRDDEIGVLQKSFYGMAEEIYEKNRALARSNTDLANANKELESFAYSVSHDLRAPLRNIDGFSKILLDDYSEQLSEKAQHYLKRVRNGTVKMSMLIDDILTFSRIVRADMELSIVPCAALVKSVLGNFSEELERRGVRVVLGDLPEINCDPSLMKSLFLNLISNAVKYTRKIEKAEITIGFDREKKAIFVKDNGVGFDMQYHAKIFQNFQRLFLPEEYEGTGIGLAIVKRVAEKHHIRVWAESEVGKGATFYIDLPIFKEVWSYEQSYKNSSR